MLQTAECRSLLRKGCERRQGEQNKTKLNRTSKIASSDKKSIDQILPCRESIHVHCKLGDWGIAGT